MTRRVGVAILTLVGAIGFGGAVWGVADILAVLSAMTACATPSRIHTEAFLMAAGISLPLLPIFALSPSAKLYKRLLVVLVLSYVTLPIGSFLLVDRVREAQGYAVATGSWSPFASNSVAFHATDCQPAG